MYRVQNNHIRGLEKAEYSMLLEMCRCANSLSNSAEWHIRHYYEHTGKHLSYAGNCRLTTPHG